MPTINIELGDYVNAKDGSLLIKKNGKWIVTTFEELNRVNQAKINKISDLADDIRLLKENQKHFIKYAKSHFFVVFNYFKIKILSGEIDVNDTEILRLDEAVLNNEISVENALEKHDFLKETFAKLYLNNKEMVEFPEV